MAESSGRTIKDGNLTAPDDISFTDNRIDGDINSGPLFNTWTQFSGMPTQNVSDSASSIHWDTFTPPNSPPFVPVYGNLDTNTEYLSQILTNIRNSPTSIETDPRLADQSMPGNSNFLAESLEGQQMYAETLNNWNSMNTYDPFGTNDVIRSSPSQELGENAHKNSKPTYSDIAKSLKSKPIKPKDKEEVEFVKKKAADPPVGKTHKLLGRKTSHFKSQHSKGHMSVPDDMESKVKPNSKYGLDNFEELDKSVSENLKSESVESIPLLSRKGSTSSVSSGTSGIEEIHLSKGPSVCPKKDNLSQKTKNGEKATKSDQAKPAEKAFFDPKRIFQNRSTSKENAGSKTSTTDSTVLNNGKPVGRAKSANENHRKSSDYINNDLRDAKKKTNQTCANKDPEKKENTNVNGKNEKKQRHSSAQTDSIITGRKLQNKNSHFQYAFDQEYIDEWISYMVERIKHTLSCLWSALVTCLLLLLGLVAYLVSGCVHLLTWMWHKVSTFVKTKLFKRYYQNHSIPSNEASSKIGLETNIVLPSTGEEAMQRLLACKGKDPYSILGLQYNVSDEDIKKYYRKQAVLVHPDKNTQPGAEEAFKILGHAFELIGEPDKRRQYNSQLEEASQAEAAMREFNDLLTKLQDKIQEAANLMRCDNCGGKHKRIPIDRPWYSARFCKRCNIRHSSKEGDVWAETSVFGFLWHYYACMEGKIYDITEWVSCKKDYFKHMQPNAHHVFYRIATEGGRSPNNNQHGRSGEADLEEFINHLFHQAMSTEQNGGTNQWQPPEPPNSATQNVTKKTRRRKKKH